MSGLTPPSSRGNGLPLGLAGATAATRYVGATASGAPVSGTFKVGDVNIGQDGTLWICTVAGTPGTWTQVGGSGGGALVQLADTTLGVDTASIDLTNISQVYNHLRIVASIRTDKAATSDTVGFRFNNDSAGNYQTQSIQAVSATPAAQQFIATTYAAILVNGATSPANGFSPVTVDIPDYRSASHLKGFQVTGGYQTAAGSGGSVSYAGFGIWSATAAAISRITFVPVGGTNLVAGTRVTLYGLL